MTLLHLLRSVYKQSIFHSQKLNLDTSFAAAVAAFLFVTLSLGTLACISSDVVISTTTLTASGLLWLSELIEEHSKLAKVVGKRCILVSLFLKESYMRTIS